MPADAVGTMTFRMASQCVVPIPYAVLFDLVGTKRRRPARWPRSSQDHDRKHHRSGIMPVTERRPEERNQPNCHSNS